uniref:Uncharacterized protein n=1 Tax=Rhodnius prolixus TaxID=13249 RepID=T1IE87_RHOPR
MNLMKIFTVEQSVPALTVLNAVALLVADGVKIGLFCIVKPNKCYVLKISTSGLLENVSEFEGKMKRKKEV